MGSDPIYYSGIWGYPIHGRWSSRIFNKWTPMWDSTPSIDPDSFEGSNNPVENLSFVVILISLGMSFLVWSSTSPWFFGSQKCVNKAVEKHMRNFQWSVQLITKKDEVGFSMLRIGLHPRRSIEKYL